MDRKRAVFVLRIWEEGRPSLGQETPTLRGSLQQMGTEDIRYFRSLRDLLHLLDQWVDWLSLPDD